MRVRAVLLPLLLVLAGGLSGAGARPSGLPSTIPGLDQARVVAAAARLGLSCARRPAPIGVAVQCTSPAGTRVWRQLTMSGPRRGEVSQVTAMVVEHANSAADARLRARFLRWAASLRYRGSAPALARRWLGPAAGTGSPTITLGDARLSLLVSRDRAVWTLTLVAPASPPDTCPCHTQ